MSIARPAGPTSTRPLKIRDYISIYLIQAIIRNLKLKLKHLPVSLLQSPKTYKKLRNRERERERENDTGTLYRDRGPNGSDPNPPLQDSIAKARHHNLGSPQARPGSYHGQDHRRHRRRRPHVQRL